MRHGVFRTALIGASALAAIALGQSATVAASPPVADSQTVANVLEDTPKVIALTAGDADHKSHLTFSVTTPPAIGSLDITSGTMTCVNTPPPGPRLTQCSVDVTYTPNAEVSGLDSFEFTVDDGVDGTSPSPGVVNITVTSVNDPPSFTKGTDRTVPEDAAAQTISNWASAISPGATNESAQVLSFVVTANTNPGLFSAAPAVSPSGTLSFTPAADANGIAAITLRLDDNGDTDNGGQNQSPTQQFTITVASVNDPPNAVNDGFFSISAGAPATPIDVLANDTSLPDDPEVLTIVSVTQGASGSVVITGDGTGLTYQPSFDFAGNDSFTYTINDPGGLSDTATVVISVVPGATYVPIAPVRTLDSRVGNGLSGSFLSGTQRSWLIAGRLGIPSIAIAVTGNLTVTGQTSAGYVTLTPGDTTTATTSTINFPVGDNRANGVFVRLGSDGGLRAVFTGSSGAHTHLVFDVTGYFVGTEDGATFVSLTPGRSLDTRVGNGLSGAFASRVSRNWQVTGRNGVPSTAIAVTGNLTVTESTGAGYVSLTPQAEASPTTSTINFPAGDTRANNVAVPLSPTGKLHAIYVGPTIGQVHVLFDVTGYFVADGSGARYVSLDPERLLDSRIGNGLAGPFAANGTRSFQVTGRGGVPPNIVAVTGNLTVTQQTRAGYVSATAVPTNPSTTSTLNFPVGDNRANGLVLPTDGSGKMALVYRAGSGATTHLVFDVTGYFY